MNTHLVRAVLPHVELLKSALQGHHEVIWAQLADGDQGAARIVYTHSSSGCDVCQQLAAVNSEKGLQRW